MPLYRNMYLTINQILLCENTSIETSLSADIQDVLTIQKGWAGITPAPITRTVTANNVVPLSGVEFDFEQKMMDNEEVEIQLQELGSGKMCVTKGYITDVPRSTGVGAVTSISFTFKGNKSKFE